MKALTNVRATTRLLAFRTVWLVQTFCAVADDPTRGARGAEVKELRSEPDPNDATRQIVLLSVKFAPHHPGFLVGYVLAGEWEFKLEGQSLQYYQPSDHFFEPPDAVHLVFRNLGATTTGGAGVHRPAPGPTRGPAHALI